MVHLENKARATEYITGQSYPLILGPQLCRILVLGPHFSGVRGVIQ